MKRILSSLLAAAVLTAPAAFAQKPGDAVTPAALGQIEWIRGEAPAQWEPGKLYVIECWATWCVPCIQNIPHLDALYDKYSEKGLRVIGVDVWEDKKDKVEAFVKSKGDGMSYPIAYTGQLPHKGGPFEEQWLAPADVKGIPHAFLVKDGKVLANIHPGVLSDEIVEGLLQSGDGEKTGMDKLAAAQKDLADKQQAMLSLQKAVQAFSKASKEKNTDAMAAAIEEVKAAQPGGIYAPVFEAQLAVMRGDWAGVEKLIDAPGDEKTQLAVRGNIARSVGNQEGVPAETIAKVTKAFEGAQTPDKKAPMDSIVLSRLYWVAGDKDKAIAEARTAVATVKQRQAGAPALTTAPFDRYVTSLEGGKMPAEDELLGWMREAAASRQSTAVKPVSPPAVSQPIEIPAAPAASPAVSQPVPIPAAPEAPKESK